LTRIQSRWCPRSSSGRFSRTETPRAELRSGHLS
jgi:hypothetical protein